MNKQYEQVKQFHKACGVPMPKVPTILSGAACNAGDIVVLDNACHEMKSAATKYPQYYGEVTTRSSYILEELVEFMAAETIEDQVDALIDMTYFILGTFTLMGIEPEQLFGIVAEANLGKIMPDGTVLRDDQGKIVKPSYWKERFAPEPLIVAEIQRQAAQ